MIDKLLNMKTNILILIAFIDDILAILLTTFIMIVKRSHFPTRTFLQNISLYEGFIITYAIEMLIMIIILTWYMIDRSKMRKHL